ncbi:hypothetical protein [Aureivirga marina]|uniref:hypothetical protein n=1 Tax=Aureivirga marina TaxID=1182451 RepID=UPI0018CB252E|nr:hypothetical protein [Aureivirga marina]
MTKQIGNTLKFNKEKYYLIQNTEGLPIPKHFGIKIRRPGSFCLKGFITEFKITKKSKLKLSELFLHLAPHEEIKEINGILPKIYKDKVRTSDGSFQKLPARLYYKKLNLNLDYSGFILIGKDISENTSSLLKWHHPIWDYQTVLELEIKNGKVISIKDLSENLMNYKEKINEEFNLYHEEISAQIDSWEKRNFKEKYK